MGAHVPLELGGRFAVDAAQMADQYPAGARAPETTGTLLPLLAVMLLGVDAQVRQCGEGWHKGGKREGGGQGEHLTGCCLTGGTFASGE